MRMRGVVRMMAARWTADCCVGGSGGVFVGVVGAASMAFPTGTQSAWLHGVGRLVHRLHTCVNVEMCTKSNAAGMAGDGSHIITKER